MANDTTITINPSQPTELEFELTTNGLHKESEVPVVRFLLTDSVSHINYTLPCEKVNKKQWVVKVPKLDINTSNDHTFVIECIIDGYYFAPAEGIVNFIDKTPKAKNIKESVVTSGKVLEEGAEMVTGQYAPNNGLLKPEKPPKQSKAKTPKTEPLDDYIDMSKISDDVTPGAGKQYVQDDNKDMDPREIIDNIIKRSKDAIQTSKPEKKGSLFARDPDGKVIIPGLESPEQKEKIKELNDRIKNVLHSK